MKIETASAVATAKHAALEVLHHNMCGPFSGLPRAAGWGYPEPYTRDCLICALGILVSGNQKLIASLRKVLETLARNQSLHGHIPSLVHDPENRGASDTTPLFLMALTFFRKVTGDTEFLVDAMRRALTWMDYQSPGDRILVAQLPTSDWRDEQWVLGFGLFVNTIVFTYLRALGYAEKARLLRHQLGQPVIRSDRQRANQLEGLVISKKPYYALWSYKIQCSERFDLLGNSLAIISGIATRVRARRIILWVEHQCDILRARGELVGELPPNFFPYITRQDSDWRSRYEIYNRPGEYHNGGVWPFVLGFYVAAIVAAGFPQLARRKLAALAEFVRNARNSSLAFGFNEWVRASDGVACGEDWQSWSAAMYLYATACVEQNRVLLF
jgi:glycosyl hydrolase family 100 (putative invertase)